MNFIGFGYKLFSTKFMQKLPSPRQATVSGLLVDVPTVHDPFICENEDLFESARRSRALANH